MVLWRVETHLLEERFMSFIKTLAKLAVGVAAVKGVGNLVQKRAGTSTGQASGTGGLGGMIEDLLGAGRGADAGSGRGQGGGSIDSLLGSLTGGFSSDANRNRSTAPSGGIGDMLRQALGGKGGAQGGVGDLLASVLGGRGAAGGSGGGALAGGLGGLLGALGGALGGVTSGSAQAATPQSLQDALASGSDAAHPAQAAALEAELEAAVMIRAMIMAAKADGALDATERARLMDAVADAPEAEAAFVEQEIAAHRSLHELLVDVPRGLEEKVYIASVLAISVDTDAERQYLRKLADGLGLTAPELAQIHQHLNLPAL